MRSPKPTPTTEHVTPQIRVGRLRRDRGISVARPTPLGNPFALAEHGRERALELYREHLATLLEEPRARAQFERILAAAARGPVTLLCWCTPAPCHADILVEALHETLRSRAVAHHPQ